MKENAFEKNKYGLFIILSVFFFVRTALLSPMQCLMMNAEYPYFRFSVESLVFIILLVVFSVLSAKLAFAFRKKAGDMAALVYIVGMSDPLFFATQDNVFKLVVNIVIQLFIFNVISEKKLIPIKAIFSVVMFISTLFVPDSILGYVPVMISIYVFACSISDKEKKYITEVIAGVLCAVAGYLINKILVNRVPLFSELFNRFGFVEFTGPNKHITLVASLVPIAVFAPLFLHQYYKNTGKSFQKKKSEREKHTEKLINTILYPSVISIVSMIFMNAGAFCAINLILPAVILTLLCVKDEICIRTMDDILHIIKEHKIISVSIFAAVFVMALRGIINYHSFKQLIFYLRY